MNRARLSRRDFLRATGAASALAAFSSQLPAAVTMPVKPINLLFIMTDQQRFDAFGRAGSKVLKTPHLDAMAREGAYFENAYTCCPVCVPARAVILTGHTIENTKVRGNGDCEPNDGADLPTFDNILAHAGYHTEYYGKWHAPYKWASTYANAVRQTGKHAARRRRARPGPGLPNVPRQVRSATPARQGRADRRHQRPTLQAGPGGLAIRRRGRGSARQPGRQLRLPRHPRRSHANGFRRRRDHRGPGSHQGHALLFDLLVRPAAPADGPAQALLRHVSAREDSRAQEHRRPDDRLALRRPGQPARR